MLAWRGEGWARILVRPGGAKRRLRVGAANSCPASALSLPGTMRVLALDAALGRCSAAVVDNDIVIAERRADGVRQAAALGGMAEAVLAQADGDALDLVAVTVGPGSFTGLRAALSLAHGVALARGIPVVGVTVAEALADALPGLRGRTLWVAIDTSRGRIFLDVGDGMRAVSPDHLPPAVGSDRGCRRCRNCGSRGAGGARHGRHADRRKAAAAAPYRGGGTPSGSR